MCTIGESGESVANCKDIAGRKARKTYMDLDRHVSTLRGVHRLLQPGVNWFHVFTLHMLRHTLLPSPYRTTSL